MIRKWAIVVGTGAAAAVVALMTLGRPSGAQQAGPSAADSAQAAIVAVKDRATLPGPEQPIFFRHDVHAGQYKIECQYCHYSVNVSQEPGIPSLQTCMGCHLVISGKDSTYKAEITKLRDAWNKKEPVQWVRVHALARHAHFPHQRHIKAMGPNACATCHGDVQRMPQVYKVNNISNMGFCISCHIERKVSRDCSVCHY